MSPATEQSESGFVIGRIVKDNYPSEIAAERAGLRPTRVYDLPPLSFDAYQYWYAEVPEQQQPPFD